MLLLRILIEVVVRKSHVFLFLSKPIVSWAALAYGRQRWEDFKLEGSLGYMATTQPLWRAGNWQSPQNSEDSSNRVLDQHA